MMDSEFRRFASRVCVGVILLSLLVFGFALAAVTFECHAMKWTAAARSKAAVEQAKGIAEATKLVGSTREYLEYLWLTGLQRQDAQIHYVPTERGRPLCGSQPLFLPPVDPDAVPGRLIVCK